MIKHHDSSDSYSSLLLLHYKEYKSDNAQFLLSYIKTFSRGDESKENHQLREYCVDVPLNKKKYTAVEGWGMV